MRRVLTHAAEIARPRAGVSARGEGTRVRAGDRPPIAAQASSGADLLRCVRGGPLWPSDPRREQRTVRSSQRKAADAPQPASRPPASQPDAQQQHNTTPRPPPSAHSRRGHGGVLLRAPSFQRQGLARGLKGLHTRPAGPPCTYRAYYPRRGVSRVSARRGARAVSRGIVDSPRWDPRTASPMRHRGRPGWLVVDAQGSSAGPERARTAPRPGII